MLRLYLHGCHRNFYGESLLIRSLELLSELEVVENLARADLIITGPRGFYYDKQPLSLHRVPKLRNFIHSNSEPLYASKKQITLFYSPEPPPIGYYQSSNCMFGVSSELLNDYSYFRLPYWMEGLDWSELGIRESTTDRVGVKAKPSSLANERDPTLVLTKPLELAIITSHLTGLRSDVVRRLAYVLPIRGFGPYFNPLIKHHNESDFKKSDVLEHCAMNLCPENTIYPGYVTEKIPEAYICNTIPVTVADLAACSLDFNAKSFINLYEHYVDMADYLASILQNKNQLLTIASNPLFNEPPSLDAFLIFLKQILSKF
jgi:hypothetical protein